jgi:hypothetical protein
LSAGSSGTTAASDAHLAMLEHLDTQIGVVPGFVELEVAVPA